MTRTWPEIIETYKKRVDMGIELIAMLKLVESIHSSQYSKGLFGWTSMHDLCITQTPVVYPYDGPFLQISPLFNGEASFKFIDTYAKSKQWIRKENENRLFERLESFLDQLHWFVKVGHVSDS